MDNEKFQELVLQQLKALTEGQTNLEAGQTKLEARQANLEAGQERIEKRLNTIYEQTAGLSEFRTEVKTKLKRHDVDIQLLKQLATN